VTAVLVPETQGTAPASFKGLGLEDQPFSWYLVEPPSAVQPSLTDVDTWQQSVGLRRRNPTQFELALFLLLTVNPLVRPKSEWVRHHSAWRDMLRYNDAAITAPKIEMSARWLKHVFDQNDTKLFRKIRFTRFSTATTDPELYNLFLDKFTEWLDRDKIIERFTRYKQPNWDGYGADPITPETIRAAQKFLKLLPKTLGEPEMAPGSDGIVALEWLFEEPHPLRKLFIDVGPGEVWSAYYRRADGTKKTIPQLPITNQTQKELEELFAELNR